MTTITITTTTRVPGNERQGGARRKSAASRTPRKPSTWSASKRRCGAVRCVAWCDSFFGRCDDAATPRRLVARPPSEEPPPLPPPLHDVENAVNPRVAVRKALVWHRVATDEPSRETRSACESTRIGPMRQGVPGNQIPTGNASPRGISFARNPRRFFPSNGNATVAQGEAPVSSPPASEKSPFIHPVGRKREWGNTASAASQEEATTRAVYGTPNGNRDGAEEKNADVSASPESVRFIAGVGVGAVLPSAIPQRSYGATIGTSGSGACKCAPQRAPICGRWKSNLFPNRSSRDCR
mmetsp:Transcript_20524/g.48285  ORF Transcript_20524/g.48285 Transcript_20524/m.48285 type:complete len:296 (-) Transcript_20524:445-1332(-)